MDVLPWFPMYAAETLSDSNFQGWTVEERGAWFTLILVCWREGSIPADQESLARLLHLDGGAMRGIWSAIGSRFIDHLDEPGRLTSPRLEIEREEAQRIHRKRVESGVKGATSRWNKGNRRNGRAIAELSGANGVPMRSDATVTAPTYPPTDQPDDVPIFDPDEWRKRREAKLTAARGGT